MFLPRVAFWSALILPSAFGEDPKSSISPGEAERAVRTLILRWNAAYSRFDAKALAALESPDVEIVDRFGELHRGRGREDNKRLWADSFEPISSRSAAPECTIEQIRLIRADVAIVYMRARYPNGITLSDGASMPAFSELNTFVVTLDRGVWLVTAQSVHQLSVLAEPVHKTASDVGDRMPRKEEY
jgi:ketosteroid isomerase-like protein